MSKISRLLNKWGGERGGLYVRAKLTQVNESHVKSRKNKIRF